VRARRNRALVCVLFVGIITAFVGWLNQSYVNEQYHWRMVMGPSLLTAELEKEKAANPGSDFKDCVNGCPTMIVVPAGRFMMGSRESEEGRSSNEGPQREVTIARSFSVSTTEVTFAQWDACFAAGACAKISDSTWGRNDRPVINVSWDDAKQYAAWLNRITGKDYRLLTEAEWEYCARAGSSARFPFGEAEEQLDQYAWYNKNAGGKTHSVANKKPNAFGLHDMHGNVFEWVDDSWHDNYTGAPTDGSAWLQGGSDSLRVIRGGAWISRPQALRAALRANFNSGGRYSNLGFRLARTLHP
jgi:formylglycine-generating enzyme required for sulfatase activity